jgi:hypothetical protein
MREPPDACCPNHTAFRQEVIPPAEEELQVGKRTVDRGRPASAATSSASRSKRASRFAMKRCVLNADSQRRRAKQVSRRALRGAHCRSAADGRRAEEPVVHKTLG